MLYNILYSFVLGKHIYGSFADYEGSDKNWKIKL